MTGPLTVKGRTRDPRFLTPCTARGTNSMDTGSVTLKRADCVLGENAWPTWDVIANDVLVEFRRITRTNP